MLSERRDFRLLTAQLTVFAGLLAWLGSYHAPVFDEIAHLPSGIAHWSTGEFDLYRVNPPLVRLVAALPLAFAPTISADVVADVVALDESPYDRVEFDVGHQFVLRLKHDCFRLFTLARWACIPFSLAGAGAVYYWASRAHGNRASGWIALLTYCFCPNLLAWGATITPDAGAAALGAVAGFAYWKWWLRPSWRSAVLAGLATGAAELTKSTWLVLFPLWPLLWLLRFTAPRHASHATANSSPSPIASPMAELSQLTMILVLGLYALNLGYGFESTCLPLKSFRFISKTLGGPDAHSQPGNRFAGTFLGELPVPVPANYLKGIDIQKYDFEYGKTSYLAGIQRSEGWWYYYLYAFMVKTPAGTLGMIVLASILTAIHPRFRRNWQTELVILAPGVAVLLLVSSQTGFNRYYRYVLPALPFLYIWCAKVGAALCSAAGGLRLTTTILVVAAAASSVATLPFSMSYFNVFAGGSISGWKHLADANIDWGQDLFELKRWYDNHPAARPLHVAFFGAIDPQIAGIDFYPVPRGAMQGRVKEPDGLADGPRPGWHVISVNHLAGYQHDYHELPYYTYFSAFRPTARVGYSMYVYFLTLPEVNAERRRLGLPLLARDDSDRE